MEEVQEQEDAEKYEQDFYGRYIYDNPHHYEIEKEMYPIVKNKMLEEQMNGNVISHDPDLIQAISTLLEHMLTLANKYQVAEKIISKMLNPKTGTVYSLEDYLDYINNSKHLSVPKTRTILSQLWVRYELLMAEKVAMRKARTEKLPFKDNVKKKFQFINWTEEEDKYFKSLRIQIARTAFMIDHYRVLEDGEVNMLMSGDNNTGKTGTSVRLIQWAHKLNRTFFKKYIEEQITEGIYEDENGDAYTKFDEIVPPKFYLRDHMIFMNESSNRKILTKNPFPDAVYDEGNATNLNLKSLDPESVENTIMAFGARNKHPFLVYNYQNSNRPTVFLREKFNMWFHKIHKKHGFLLIRQRLVLPPKDPWLVKKLEKILETGKEEAIYHFFKYHPYTVAEFKDMRDMNPHARKIYSGYRQKYQREYAARSNENAARREWRGDIAKEIAEDIDRGYMLYDSLNDELMKRGISLQTERNSITRLIDAHITDASIKKQIQKKRPEGGKNVEP